MSERPLFLAGSIMIQYKRTQYQQLNSNNTPTTTTHKLCIVSSSFNSVVALKFKTVTTCQLSESRRGGASESPDWTANQSGDSFRQRSNCCFGRHMSRDFFRTKASFEAVVCSPGFEARIEASVSHCHH
ncbi:hypothetical protein ABVT39_026927 [Epinephelus coioides]